MKGNHGHLYDLVAEWLEHAAVQQRPPDHVQTDKGHGRVERRELWLVPAGNLRTYLQADFAWPAVRYVGLIRRSRRHLRQAEWESVITTFWIAGGTQCPDLTPAQAQHHLRAH